MGHAQCTRIKLGRKNHFSPFFAHFQCVRTHTNTSIKNYYILLDIKWFGTEKDKELSFKSVMWGFEFTQVSIATRWRLWTDLRQSCGTCSRWEPQMRMSVWFRKYYVPGAVDFLIGKVLLISRLHLFWLFCGKCWLKLPLTTFEKQTSFIKEITET